MNPEKSYRLLPNMENHDCFGCDREALVKGILYGDDKEICARSVRKFVLFSTEKMRKMGVADPGIFDWFERFIERSPPEGPGGKETLRPGSRGIIPPFWLLAKKYG